MSKTVRTRFAPSPTGFMHVGNLRTALYEYLVAKSQGGTFVLRIEDTDQERKVEGAVDIIYQTMKRAGLIHDEGPDIGGEYGPYVQSERKAMYLPYAKQLIDMDKAYYCFCSKERLDMLRENADEPGAGYDRHCRYLPKAVQSFVQDRQDNTGRDEHRRVPDEVPYHVARRVKPKQVDEGDQVQAERKRGRGVEHQRLDLSVDGLPREKDESDDHRQIDVHEQEHCFAPKVDFSVFDPDDDSDEQPDRREDQFKCNKMDRHSSFAMCIV